MYSIIDDAERRTTMKTLSPITIFRRPSRRSRQRGAMFVESALLAPLALSFYIGIVASNTLVQSNRSLSWAVSQAMLMSGLRATPTTTSTGTQTQFQVRFVPGANGGSFSWTNSSGAALANAIPVSARNCSGGSTDVACGAWLTMQTVGQLVNSSQGPSSFSEVLISVTVSDLEVDAGDSAQLGKYRKLTISAIGSFTESTRVAMRAASSIGSLLPSFTVTRSEAIG